MESNALFLFLFSFKFINTVVFVQYGKYIDIILIISTIICLLQSHESSGLENMCRLLPGNLRTMVSVYFLLITKIWMLINPLSLHEFLFILFIYRTWDHSHLKKGSTDQRINWWRWFSNLKHCIVLWRIFFALNSSPNYPPPPLSLSLSPPPLILPLPLSHTLWPLLILSLSLSLSLLPSLFLSALPPLLDPFPPCLSLFIFHPLSLNTY